MEIYTLELSIPHDGNDEPWLRVIEVKESFALEQLHAYIQEIVNFDNDHMYEFCIGKNPRNRSEQISTDKKLNEIYPLTGYKLYYLFDFGDEWLFQIKKSRKRVPVDGSASYPRIINSNGVNPEQYPDYEE